MFLLLGAGVVCAADPQLTLRHLTGGVYVVEDPFYGSENSAVYVGPDAVTVVGATWTPETARRLVDEIRKVTPKPIREVVNTNYHPDRAGGNAYFRSAGIRIVSTALTRDLLKSDWDAVVEWTRRAIPDYPALPVVLPDLVYPGNFELQGGRVRAIYLGPSHTRDGIFIHFPEEKVLYGGCILKEQLGNMTFADRAEYPRTLRRLQDLHLLIGKIIAGHWSAEHGPELIEQYLALLAAAK